MEGWERTPATKGVSGPSHTGSRWGTTGDLQWTCERNLSDPKTAVSNASVAFVRIRVIPDDPHTGARYYIYPLAVMVDRGRGFDNINQFIDY